MPVRKSFRLVGALLRLPGLVTPGRLQRLAYYARARKFDIVRDRVWRLLTIGFASPIELTLYPRAACPDRMDFPSFDAPLVSIVIPVYNQWSTTRSCLASILANTVGETYEVIVADDCSRDDTRYLSAQAGNVRVVTNATNLGFLKTCNHAARAARGKYLVLLNNDTNVQPDWLSRLVELAERDPRVAVVGPMLLYPNGRLQEAGGIVWQDGSAWNYGRHDYPERPEYNYVKPVDYISGACILVRKSLWDEIGGFDDRFTPAYYEDTDLAFEVRRRGYRVLYQPLSRVVHLEGISHGTDLASGIKSRQASNQHVFGRKWHDILVEDHGRDPRDLSRARDRSLHRRRLLFIDHYVPLRDQDAGSKSTFLYLALLAELGYQITFLGDNFVGYEPYTTELQQMGIEVLYGPRLQRHWRRWLAANGAQFDYAFISRPHIAIKYLPYIRRYCSAKLMYCGLDLHCLRAERHFALEGKRAYLKEARKWALWEGKILRSVDVAYFFSTFEEAEVRRRFSCEVARTIPLYFFNDAELLESPISPFSERVGLLFVGGFMHAPNVDAVLWFAHKVLPLILRRLPQVVVKIVGSNAPAEIRNLACEHVHIIGRLTDEALRQHYNETRLVIAPLRFGAGVKGKIVEAMRYGIPTVTTALGAEGIPDGELALRIADSPIDFANEVVDLYTSASAWQTAAQHSLDIIRKHFSKDAVKSILQRDMPG